MTYIVFLGMSLACFAASKPIIWKVFFSIPFSETRSRLLLISAWIILLLTIYVVADQTGSYGILTLIGYSSPMLVVYICLINMAKTLKGR